LGALAGVLQVCRAEVTGSARQPGVSGHRAPMMCAPVIGCRRDRAVLVWRWGVGANLVESLEPVR
jgi:hypothetical protein